MIPKAIKITILGVVIILAIMAAYVVVFYILTTSSASNRKLYLDLLEGEDQLDSFNRNYVNLTQTDLSPYPTLWEAIQTVIDPSSNITYSYLSISTDEYHLIIDELLNRPDSRYIYDYFAYYEHRFQISFGGP
jgi:hypothetical protein